MLATTAVNARTVKSFHREETTKPLLSPFLLLMSPSSTSQWISSAPYHKTALGITSYLSYATMCQDSNPTTENRCQPYCQKVGETFCQGRCPRRNPYGPRNKFHLSTTLRNLQTPTHKTNPDDTLSPPDQQPHRKI